MSKQPKIQLYKKESTKEQILKKYGDFILDDICTYCITEENFGTSEYGLDAEFITDDNGLFKHIEEESYLKVRMDYGEEIFSIVDIQKTPTSIVVYARQITYVESMHMWLEDVRPEEKNGLDALIHMQEGAIGNHDLEFESDITDINTSYFINKSFLEAIHTADNSFLNRWGGEIQRRGYKLIINKRIGIETDYQIRSGRNLTGFEATTNMDNVITRIKPTGFNGITIDGFVDSPNLNKYKYTRTAVYNYDNIKLRSDLEENYDPEAEENKDDVVFDTLSEAQAELIKLAQAEYENEIDILSATYNINFVDLSRTEEYKNYSKLEVVNLGDYIHVYEEKHNLDIVVRAIKKKFNVLKGMTEEITVNNGAKTKEVPSLSALSGRVDSVVENVVATNMDVEILKANKADITELKATHADIEILNTEVATIGTLINGNLTSNNIQSMIITGDKFTVENGFIKNAMIDSLSANKINTGTLNTNNVNIQSEDGSMILNGSTQQFKDKNGVVRIQIGKDANGEFTFCLFSQDGVGVLIDDTGIQTGAIGDGLIVNDMINDNANISGGKLDINSVISSINENGTTTLKSSRIYLDEQGQSLQVAFNQLKTKVDTIEDVAIEGDLANVMEQVTTNTTNLEIAQGQINSLISNTTITKSNGSVVQLKDEFNSTKNTVDSHTQTISSMTTNINKLSGEIDNVETKTSSLEQNLNGFKTTVSSTYATQSSLNTTNTNVSNAKSTADSALSKANTNATNISSLTTRVSTAESKITSTAIVNTVTSSSSWTTQTNNISTANSTANTALNNSKTNASNISGLTTRMSSAESKITSSAIINTVTSSTNWTTQTSNITKAQNTANTANNTANTNKTNISSLTTRMSTAESKITSTAIVNTVTSSSSWATQTSNITKAQNTANTANNTANTNKSTISTVQSSVTQNANKISWVVKSGTSSSNMTLTDRVYSLISNNITLTASHINLHGYVTANGGFSIDTNGKMTATGATIKGTGSGNKITINNADYEISTGNTVKGFFGLRTLDDGFDTARLALSSEGLDNVRNNYFVIVPYNANANPSNYSYPYVDLAYRCKNYIAEGKGDCSNIKMFGDGNIRIAPIKELHITTSFTNGSYNGTGAENNIATFGSANHGAYNLYMDVRAIRNYQNNNGLVFSYKRTSDSTNEFNARCIVYNDGFRTFAPYYGTSSSNPHYLGSGSYRWQTLYTVNALNTSSDRTLKENIKYLSSTPNTRTIKDETLSIQDMYDFIRDDLYLASYNWIHDPEKEDKLGFIAQDIIDTKVGEKIIVCNRDRDNTLGYDSGNFEATIAGALQVAIQKIEQLEQEIKILKGE